MGICNVKGLIQYSGLHLSAYETDGVSPQLVGTALGTVTPRLGVPNRERQRGWTNLKVHDTLQISTLC